MAAGSQFILIYCFKGKIHYLHLKETAALPFWAVFVWCIFHCFCRECNSLRADDFSAVRSINGKCFGKKSFFLNTFSAAFSSHVRRFIRRRRDAHLSADRSLRVLCSQPQLTSFYTVVSNRWNAASSLMVVQCKLAKHIMTLFSFHFFSFCWLETHNTLFIMEKISRMRLDSRSSKLHHFFIAK